VWREKSRFSNVLFMIVWEALMLVGFKRVLWFVFLLSVSLAGCDKQKAALQFHNMDITGSIEQADFNLMDHNGEPANLARFKNKVVVVFFGFSHCPDVCPNTLQEWKLAFDQLSDEQRKQAQLLLISVDPKRDTSARLKVYMQAFHPSFLGLSGPLDQVKKINTNYKAFFEKNSKNPDSIDHTAASYVIDKQGHVRLFVRHDGNVKNLVEDLQSLINEGF